MHGRIANTPAHEVQVTVDGDAGEIAVVGIVDETRLFGNKLRLATTADHAGGPAGIDHHRHDHQPFGGAGRVGAALSRQLRRAAAGAGGGGCCCRSRSWRRATRRPWPSLPDWNRLQAADAGMGEAALYFELAADAQGQTQALLCSAAGDRGVSLKFNTHQLPCFSLWKNRQAAADGYVTGLEPGINFPNAKSVREAAWAAWPCWHRASRAYRLAAGGPRRRRQRDGRRRGREAIAGRRHAGDSLGARPGLVAGPRLTGATNCSNNGNPAPVGY